MAPLPPPPPPAPPPPPPMNGPPPPPPMSGPPKLSKSGAADRNALLSQIHGGTRLKKTAEVNDRSSPMIEGKSSSGTAAKSSISSGAKPTSNGPMQLGGLFAGGVPKLRSTGSKLVTNGPSNSVNVSNTYTKAGDSDVRPIKSTSIKTSLEEKLQFLQQNNTNNNSSNSFLHSKFNSSNDNNGLITNKNKYHTINLSKPRERPHFMSSEGKGQAPQVPTVTQNNGTAPSLPKKPPGVQRSNSQSNSRTGSSVGRGVRPGPPNIKPPPPPKITNGNSNAPQPPFPSKPLNATRRQSYGEDQKSNSSDLWNGRSDTSSISSIVSNFEQHGVKPPAPPRNTSVTNGFSQSPTYPPPPPPVSSIPSKPNESSVRMPQMKTAPPVPNVNRSQSTVRPPMGPPPPPPHRNVTNGSSLYPSPAPPPPPPSQTKVIPTPLRNEFSLGPTPPVRNTSISRDDFASRFQTFEAICKLPAPSPLTNANKVYTSHMQQSMRRRDPPPPPPLSNGLMAHNSPNSNAHYNSNNMKKSLSSNPMLHIQIGSSVPQC